MRIDEYLAKNGLVRSRSHAKDLVNRGKVRVNGDIVTKAGYQIKPSDNLVVDEAIQLVSRAGEKLASVYKNFNLDFNDKVVLDVGSSTGGFTDFALQNGAKKVIAVDTGTDQLAEKLRIDPRVELHEKTDIRDYSAHGKSIDYALMDVSFISIRKILPAVKELSDKDTIIIAMLKPQFEATIPQKNKGVIKNSRVRKEILSEFEAWVKRGFVISASMDSQLSGTKGNVERFYRLQKT
ncbi:MAG TPA: TlyA family RNA methyltransferase [Candidatus Saccharibacteria bacterium]|nr:TlyA family RNA methyltransferase [Candidatus Saccharibacteria bacterium]